jgi:hypothetical protein
VSARKKHPGFRPGPFSHPAFGDYHLYAWCGRCQRVELTCKWHDGGWRCPSADCEGGPEDAWRWEEVRRAHGDLPNHPLLGRTYKLYAFDWEIEESAAHDAAARDSAHSELAEALL